MPLEKRTIFKTDRGYVRDIMSQGGRFSGYMPAHVSITPKKSEAKQYPLGRSTSIAETKLGRTVGWGNYTKEEIEVEVAAPEDIPQANESEMQHAVKLFEYILAQLRDDFRKKQFTYYNHITTEFVTAWETSTEPKNWQRLDKIIDAAFPGRIDPNRKHFITGVLLDIPDGRNYQLADPSKVKAATKKRVDEDERNMFQSFIAKQTEKVAAIIKSRGYEAEGKVGSDLTGSINFKLTDGSSFTMRFQIVWKTSQLGNLFWQFPTTFHNAVKADGTRITPASEAKMKREF
jgi:hypothetical protein